MSDLVDRLRNTPWVCDDTLHEEAASTIDRLVDSLRAIAEPDHLLDANEGAFNIHAARRMQRQAQSALTATGFEVASR